MDPYYASFSSMNPFNPTTMSTLASMFILIAAVAAAYVLYKQMQDEKQPLTRLDIDPTWLTAFSKKSPEDAKKLIAMQFPDWPSDIDVVPSTSQGVQYMKMKIDAGKPVVFLIVGADGLLTEWNPSRGMYNNPVQVYGTK